MSELECPDCKGPIEMETRKEKVKSGKVKMAINIDVFSCTECEKIFVSEEEQRKYDMRVKNFHAKVKIQDDKVSTH